MQQVFTDAKALGHNTYVLTGISAGAALSQFGALGLTGVKGVYLFGKYQELLISLLSVQHRNNCQVQTLFSRCASRSRGCALFVWHHNGTIAKSHHATLRTSRCLRSASRLALRRC